GRSGRKGDRSRAGRRCTHQRLGRQPLHLRDGKFDMSGTRTAMSEPAQPSNRRTPPSEPGPATAGSPERPSKASVKPTPRPKTGPVMRGARIVVESLLAEGVDIIFGYPGGAILHVYDELHKAQDRIR